MDLRVALYELSARYGLDAEQHARLHGLAGFDRAPSALAYWLPRAVAVLGAALAGLGVIMWVAANWAHLGRAPRFLLLQSLFVAMCAGAIWRPAACVPLALLALLAIGGLLAYFGQTYQTGADPWQLFAMWAMLGLPLCLAGRSDVLWTPWAIVAMAAISLWMAAHTGHRWNWRPDDLAVHALSWGAALSLSFALAPTVIGGRGTASWASRSAFLLTAALITITGLLALFAREGAAQYAAAVAVMALAGGLLTRRPLYDLFGVSVAALSVNLLLVAGAGRLLDHVMPHTVGLIMLATALLAAILLGLTVRAILALSRHGQGEGVAT